MPLSGVHSIMIEKIAQAKSEGEDARPFHYIFHQVQSCGVRPYLYSIRICTLWCKLFYTYMFVEKPVLVCTQGYTLPGDCSCSETSS